MKTWKSFGSAHSGNLTVIGEFKNVDDAQLAEEVLGDFVNAALEVDCRRGDNGVFIRAWWHHRKLIKAWKNRLPDMLSDLGPTRSELMRTDVWVPHVRLVGTTVTVSGISSLDIRGIIKLMFLNSPTQIRIPGEPRP